MIKFWGIFMFSRIMFDQRKEALIEVRLQKRKIMIMINAFEKMK